MSTYAKLFERALQTKLRDDQQKQNALTRLGQNNADKPVVPLQQNVGNASWNGMSYDGFQALVDKQKQNRRQQQAASAVVTQLQERQQRQQFLSQPQNVGWLSDSFSPESVGLTPKEAAARRQDIYKQNSALLGQLETDTADAQKKYNDLSEQLRMIKVARGRSGGVAYSTDYIKNLEQQVAEAEAALRRVGGVRSDLQMELRRYEDSQGTYDPYYALIGSPGFGQSRRDYANPSRDDFTRYAVMTDAGSFRTDANGVTYDAFGNPIDDSWPGYQKPVIQDKLGLWLETDASARDEAVGDVLGNVDMWADAIRQGNSSNWDRLSDDEIEIYYYLLQNEGQESAYKFLDGLTPELNRRSYADMDNAVKNASGFKQRAALNAGSILGSSIVGAPLAFASDATAMLTGQRVNPYGFGHGVQNFSQAVRSDTANDIAEVIGGKEGSFRQIAGQFAANTYQAAMSGLDSAVGVGTIGKGYTALMGAGAASSRARELAESGAGNKEIALGSLGSGVLEAFFEYASVENFFQEFLETPPSTMREWIKKALAQGGVEASEETFTELGNLVLDAFNRGINSDDQQKIRRLMESGLSENQARLQAARDDALDVFWAAYGGFVSGGAMGLAGGSNVVFSQIENIVDSARDTSDAGRTVIKGGNISQLAEAVNALPDSTTKTQLLEQIQDLSGLTPEVFQQMSPAEQAIEAQRVGRLMQRISKANVRTINQNDRGAFLEKAREAAKAKNAADVEKAAKALTKLAFDESTSRSERRLAAELGGKEAVQQILDSPEYRAASREATAPQTEAFLKTQGLRATAENLSEIRQRLKDNATADYDAEAMSTVYIAGQNEERYAAAFRDAYDFGRFGESLESALGSKSTSYLTDGQVRAAYAAGQQEARKVATEFYRTAGSVGQTNARLPGKMANVLNRMEISAALAEGRAEALKQEGNNGLRVRQSSQRPAGADSGRTVSGVEGSTGQAAAEEGERGAKADSAKRTSSRAIGLINGTDNQNIEVVPPAEYSDDLKEAAQIAKDNGLMLVPFRGDALELTQTNRETGRKEVFRVRGTLQGETLYVRADDPQFFAAQIADHEATHGKILRGDISVSDVRNRMAARFSESAVQQLNTLYAEAYSGSGLSDGEILTELICDAHGGMNLFAEDAALGSYVNVLFGAIQQETANSAQQGVRAESSGTSSTAEFSREAVSAAELQRENRLLKKRIEYLKKQTTLSGAPAAREEDVRRVTREICAAYNNSGAARAVMEDMQDFADRIRRDFQAFGLTLPEMQDEAQAIARTILSGASVDINSDQAETLKDLRRYLRATPISVPAEVQNDFPDWKDWRRQNRAIRVNQDGRGIDSVWAELQEQFGKGMFPDSISNPSDQLAHLGERLQALAPAPQNPYRNNMELSVRQCANDIINALLSDAVRDAPSTFADRKQAQVDRLQNELDTVIRDNRNRAIERQLSREMTEKRGQIAGYAEKLRKMVTNPRKGSTQHAPTPLVNAVIQVCQIFDEAQQLSIDRQFERMELQAQNLLDEMANMGATQAIMDSMRSIDRRSARLQQAKARFDTLSEQYENLRNDPAFSVYYDEFVAKQVENMGKILKEKTLYDLNDNELDTVLNAVKSLVHNITHGNQVFVRGKNREAMQIINKWSREIQSANLRSGAVADAIRKFGMYQMSPDTFFGFTSGFVKNSTGSDIAAMFSQGTARRLGVERQYYQHMADITESKDKAVQDELRRLLRDPTKNLITLELKTKSGKEIKVTRGMAMQIAMLLDQEDSLNAIASSGFRVPNMADYYAGKTKESYTGGDIADLVTDAAGLDYSKLTWEIQKIRREIESGVYNGSDDPEILKQFASMQKYTQLAQEISNIEEDLRRENDPAAIRSGTALLAEKNTAISELGWKVVAEMQAKAQSIISGQKVQLLRMRNNITDQLTPLEKRLMQKASQWYEHTGNLMTEVFTDMYGFQPRLVKNYVPMHRLLSEAVSVDLRTDIDNVFNLENSGFTKERVPSTAPLLMTDFFVELMGQKDRIARYYGYAQVQRDFNKIWKTKGIDSGYTVNDMISSRLRTGQRGLDVGGETYVENLIRSIAGVNRSNDIWSSFYGRSAAASLSANARVAVSQLASIPTAAGVVGWRNMAVGFSKGLPTAFSKAKKAELANRSVWFYQRYRGSGGITELSDLRNTGGAWDKVVNSKPGKWLFNWCQAMDVAATSTMWAMAEEDVQRRGIAKGSAEYDQAVEQTYEDIIRRTQPNYTETERSDMLRDSRGGVKIFTMFKTQSNQNLNMLIRANGEFAAAKRDFKAGRNGVTQADVKQACGALANAYTSVVLGGSLGFVLLRTLVNFALGKVNPYRDKKTDEVTAAGVVKGMTKELASSLFGMVAVGGDVFDFVYAIMSGDKYYGISDSAISALSDLMESGATISRKLVQSVEEGENKVTGKHVWALLSDLSAILGIPLDNAKGIYDAVMMWGRDIANGTFGQFTREETTARQKQYRLLKASLEQDDDKAAYVLASLLAEQNADTDQEANSNLLSDFKQSLHYWYKKGEVTEEQVQYALDDIFDVDKADAEALVYRWDFKMANPDIDLSDAAIDRFRNLEKTGITPESWAKIYKHCNSLESDKDRNGKAISGSLKAKVVKYIRSLPLSWSQKEAIWDAVKSSNQWKDENLP